MRACERGHVDDLGLAALEQRRAVVIGKRSISAESGRMSVTLRPSMRTPSSTIRFRTIFL